jgi:glycine cleavage system H protein
MMGKSPAILPTDRQYAKNHMWAKGIDEGYRFGFSAYAVRLFGDLRNLDWSVAAETPLDQGQQVGFVEGSKATSDLYAPASGTLLEINAEVLADPTLINSNLYDKAWLFSIATPQTAFLSPEEYLAHLESCWPLAQRLLKGQVGRQ